MKKQYQIPELKLKNLSSTDVITTSPLSDEAVKSDDVWAISPWKSEVSNNGEN